MITLNEYNEQIHSLLKECPDFEKTMFLFAIKYDISELIIYYDNHTISSFKPALDIPPEYLIWIKDLFDIHKLDNYPILSFYIDFDHKQYHIKFLYIPQPIHGNDIVIMRNHCTNIQKEVNSIILNNTLVQELSAKESNSSRKI